MARRQTGSGRGERAELMRKAAKPLSDEQIEMLADWSSGLVQD
ncbi:hypothetical protein [Litoreibacter arenae]|uniref:Uncharacterized protein n=1 Tax=Litoreibacter arenae DSM 19593 TaxID=1123360 RepID=S9QFG3_9RHOB|nr:hypothetical protein [Litoreibacter arenae]EPX78597.1 hypothetical protein thalar_02389 [Litoreibacter arenae DSM 19593]